MCEKADREGRDMLSTEEVAKVILQFQSKHGAEITPDEAKAVADVVEIQRRVIETESLEIRIAALERRRK